MNVKSEVESLDFNQDWKCQMKGDEVHRGILFQGGERNADSLEDDAETPLADHGNEFPPLPPNFSTGRALC